MHNIHICYIRFKIQCIQHEIYLSYDIHFESNCTGCFSRLPKDEGTIYKDCIHVTEEDLRRHLVKHHGSMGNPCFLCNIFEKPMNIYIITRTLYIYICIHIILTSLATHVFVIVSVCACFVDQHEIWMRHMKYG